MTPASDPLEPLLRLAGRRGDVPEARAARVRAAVHAAWRRSRRARLWRRAALAAAAALAAGAAVVAGLHVAAPQAPEVFARVERSDSGAWRPETEIPVGAAIVAPRPLSLRMPDGASLRLASGTRLRAVAARRLRLETGRLYADAAGAAGLAVEAGELTMTDLGTQFQVDLESGAVRLRVREGRVRATRSDGADWTLGAGEALRVAGDAVERAALAPDDPTWGWAEALARPPRIEDEPLRPFLAWVARERGLRLAFADPAADRLAATLRLHGDVSDLSLDEALEVVLATTGFDASTRDGRLEVRSTAN